MLRLCAEVSGGADDVTSTNDDVTCADLDMLRLVSAGSGGQAQRIFDDADMDTQVQA